MPFSNWSRVSYARWSGGLRCSSSANSFLLKTVDMQSLHILISRATISPGFSDEGSAPIRVNHDSYSPGRIVLTCSDVKSNFIRTASSRICTDDFTAKPAMVSAKRPRTKFLLAERAFCHSRVVFPRYYRLLKHFPLISLPGQRSDRSENARVVCDKFFGWVGEQLGQFCQALFQPRDLQKLFIQRFLSECHEALRVISQKAMVVVVPFS